MRLELKRIQHEVGITSIYVTHDQSEALVMSDEIIVMSKGRIQQKGGPREIYARPVNAYVSNFIGVANLLQGPRDRGHRARPRRGRDRRRRPHRQACLPARRRHGGGRRDGDLGAAGKRRGHAPERRRARASKAK